MFREGLTLQASGMYIDLILEEEFIASEGLGVEMEMRDRYILYTYVYIYINLYMYNFDSHN